MPGPNSTPNPQRKRTTVQLVPPKLAARIASYELSMQSKPTPTGFRKPGSQK